MRPEHITKQLELALNHLSAGLGELEQAIIAAEQLVDVDDEALNDSAGAIALGVQELRRQLEAGL